MVLLSPRLVGGELFPTRIIQCGCGPVRVAAETELPGPSRGTAPLPNPSKTSVEAVFAEAGGASDLIEGADTKATKARIIRLNEPARMESILRE
jgi:hypothetical protein